VWTAAIPPVRFLYLTSKNPVAENRSASFFWSGNFETERGKYVYAARDPLIIPPILGKICEK
jgi:hypothetical protein